MVQRSDPEHARLIRVTSVFCIAMALMCAVILVAQIIVGTDAATHRTTWIGFVVGLVLPLPLWVGVPLRWWVVLVTGAVAAQTLPAAVQSADPGSVLSWLAVPVLMSRVIGGRRGGWMSMGIAAIACIGYSAALFFDVAPLPSRPRVGPQEEALYVLLLVGCVYGFGEVSARGYEVAMGRATESTARLEREVAQHLSTRIALEQAHGQVIQTARVAGMAEVATGVLHNVGNALNTVNVTAQVVRESVSAVTLEKRLERLAEVVVAADTDRALVARYVTAIARQAAADRCRLTEDMERLTGAVAHVASVVSAQQAHARNRGVIQTFTVAELFDEAVRLARPVLSQHHVDVTQTGALEFSVTNERHQIVQILENLVRNGAEALQAAPAGRKILLSAVVEEQRLLLSVHDSGPGVPVEDRSRIFQHGFTRKTTGSGFGLHVSAIAAKSLGGQLDLCSDAQGACFTLWIPLSDEDAVAVKPAPVTLPEESAGSRALFGHSTVQDGN
jgi:signal transduction histidine kinase